MTDDEREAHAQERHDILETLQKHRGFLRQAVEGVTDEQARSRPTVSELSLGGLVKHVTRVETTWYNFILEGPRFEGPPDEAVYEDHTASFRMEVDETLDELLAAYDEAARSTDELVTRLESFDASQPLPEAPWFPPGVRWTARRTLIHVVAETAQHAGHADIIRETIDGAKTMG
jgi:uncharacterized damage-inducible protein DinB